MRWHYRQREERPCCPHCCRWSEVRRVPKEPGDAHLVHYCCDRCKIGWYENPGARSHRLTGNAESARAAYRPPPGSPGGQGGQAPPTA